MVGSQDVMEETDRVKPLETGWKRHEYVKGGSAKEASMRALPLILMPRSRVTPSSILLQSSDSGFRPSAWECQRWL
jgi:hypothetical protein